MNDKRGKSYGVSSEAELEKYIIENPDEISHLSIIQKSYSTGYNHPLLSKDFFFSI
jgi:hypothetical protein